MKSEPPKTAAELLQRYAKGERLFEEIDSSEVWELDNADLHESQFYACWFSASSRGANLRNTIFRGCNIKGSNFENADLTNAVITDSALCGTSFKDAKLEGANFTDSFWHSYTFQEGEDLTKLSES